MHSYKGLESNPVILNEFLREGGVQNGSLCEVFSLDDDALSFIPTPAHALILLYPHPGDVRESIVENESQPAESSSVYFMRQHGVRNACGIIAVLHAIANSPDIIFENNSIFKDFITRTKSMSSLTKCVELGKDASIIAAAEHSALDGQTAALDGDAELEYHYVCFVSVDNSVWELDGLKQSPLFHTRTTPDTFLQDCVGIIKREYIEKLSDSIQFNIMVLTTS